MIIVRIHWEHQMRQQFSMICTNGSVVLCLSLIALALATTTWIDNHHTATEGPKNPKTNIY
jgi:hypothetical protein